jgi:hypothetical protein
MCIGDGTVAERGRNRDIKMQDDVVESQIMQESMELEDDLSVATTVKCELSDVTK